MDLKTIETKYGIVFPNTYRELYKSGMLNWGEFGQNWIKNVYPSLRKSPPLLLYANDFELIDFERIDEEIGAFKDPEDYRCVNPKFNFIPFAQNGGGDLYCFQYDNSNNGNIPIVLVWHDMNAANVLAKNLQDFMFRSMLETLTDFDKNYSLLAEGDLCLNLEKYLDTHKAFMTEQQNQIVHHWYGLIDAERKNSGILVSEEEIEKITQLIANVIQFDDLNKEFEYQLEELPVVETAENKRRTGMLRLEISPILESNHKLFASIKTLNWRKDKLKDADTIMFCRKNSIFFGIPSMETIGDTYKDKLIALKEKYPNNLTLSFIEDKTDMVYKLF